jgi:hypothetical protein
MTEITHQDSLKAWEESFQDGIAASSRTTPPEWPAGNVHVVRDMPPRTELTRTDMGYYHDLVMFTDEVDFVEQHVQGCPHKDEILNGSGNAREWWLEAAQ